MDALLFEAEATGRLVELADEMAEDPRCRVLVMGADDAGGIVFSIWDDEVVEEVARGLAERSDGRLRRLAVPEGGARWQ